MRKASFLQEPLVANLFSYALCISCRKSIAKCRKMVCSSVTSEAPHCHHPEKDTACQPAVVRAMLKEKEGLSINSVFLKMLKKDNTCLGQTDPATSMF